MQIELFREFVLRLFDKASGRNDQAVLKPPRVASAFIGRPAMTVLPAPPSSARRNRSCRRSGIAPYTAIDR